MLRLVTTQALAAIALLTSPMTGNTVLATPDIRERIVSIGDLVLGGTPQDTEERIKHDYDRYGAIAGRLKITSD